MEVRYRLSEVEFCTAHRAYLRKRLLNFRTVFLLTLALGMAGAEAQLLGPSAGVASIFGGIWLVVVAFLVWAYLALPGRVYARNPGYRGEILLEFDDGGVRWERDATVSDAGEAAAGRAADLARRKDYFPWTDLRTVDERAGFFLVERKQGLPIPLPVGSVPDAEEFRGLCGRGLLGGP